MQKNTYAIAYFLLGLCIISPVLLGETLSDTETDRGRDEMMDVTPVVSAPAPSADADTDSPETPPSLALTDVKVFPSF